MKIIALFLTLGNFICSLARFETDVDTELVLVSVLFRDGAHTVEEFYPKDPNKNETFYPIGFGGLTNGGKLDQYYLGKYLRTLYADFLGDYTEQKVYVRSIDSARAKMGAQLVLAGLFPPSGKQLWNKYLKWQPIPIEYTATLKEDLFTAQVTCDYTNNVKSHLAKQTDIEGTYKDLFIYLQNETGLAIDGITDIYDLFSTLQIEKDQGLIMPRWTENVFPEPLKTITLQTYSYLNSNPQLKMFNSGYLLKKIIDDSKSKISGNSTKKIFLYSGHEINLGLMLNALKVDYNKTHLPPNGSALIFEILKTQDQYFIKLSFKYDNERNLMDLVVPGCDVLCPFEKFLEMQKDLMPDMSVEEMCKMKETESKAATSGGRNFVLFLLVSCVWYFSLH